ncbi:MAG: leucine-rich repeat domain-containing protein, partial [Proteiniphilum sp.]|nr:leucine-rich repeat domain-containing protein [Proteiniphilum sp.]
NTGRTLSLTATMPGDKSDGPTTRVDLAQLGDKSIALTWEETDELQLAFVQGETKIKSTARVASISENRKDAQFEILIPANINTLIAFDLYGVYGGGGLDNTDPTLVKLPENAGNAGSLATIKSRKDVMLYFSSKDVQAANPKASVVFKHLGSLFSITFADAITQDMLDQIEANKIAEARLVGVNNDGNVNWAYNAGTAVGNSFDLVTRTFKNTETSGNYISLSIANSDLTIGKPLTAWAWYPPLADVNWPELSLELRNTSNEVVTATADRKRGRTAPTASGKSFYFYATWDATGLYFADESLTPDLIAPRYHVMHMGSLSAMLTQTQKDTITTMIITGEINKADFEVMKKEMPKLTYIDLKDVTCENNEIPALALGDYRPGFNNTTISTIIFPESITKIGDSSIELCTGLTGSLTIPDRVITIGQGAFNGCTGLTGSLHLSKALKNIGTKAFYKCSGLTGTVTMPEGVTSIDASAFELCSNITAFTFPHTSLITYTSKMLPTTATVEVPRNAYNTYKAAAGWKNHTIGIYGHLYNDEYYVRTMGTLGASLTASKKASITKMTLFGEINKADFEVMKKEIPNLTHVDLKDVTCEGNKIPDYAFGGEYSKDANKAIKTVILPLSITSIGKYAFNNCTGLTGNLTIPEGVTLIGENAFSSCTNLKGSLTIPTSVIEIGKSAFAHSGFTGSLILPENIKSIRNYAFYECIGFTGKIVFPIGLTHIEGLAFDKCKNITAFRFPHTTPIEYTPVMLPHYSTVEVPSSLVATYKAHPDWGHPTYNHTFVGY